MFRHKYLAANLTYWVSLVHSQILNAKKHPYHVSERYNGSTVFGRMRANQYFAVTTNILRNVFHVTRNVCAKLRRTGIHPKLNIKEATQLKPHN